MGLIFHSAAVAAVLFAGVLSAAQPFVGTWQLDPARSSGDIPKGETVVVQQRGKTLLFRIDVVTGGSASAPLEIVFTAPMNGGAGSVEKGPYDGVVVKRIGGNALEITYMESGKAARDAGGSAWTMVFEKQRPGR